MSGPAVPPTRGPEICGSVPHPPPPPPSPVIVRETVTLCVRLPLVPVITTEYVPASVVVSVETVSVVEPPVAMEAAVKWPVAPEGNPLTLSVSVPVNPLIAAVDTVYRALEPRAMLWKLGVAEMLKFGGGGGALRGGGEGEPGPGGNTQRVGLVPGDAGGHGGGLEGIAGGGAASTG